jgi:hypothetical protein
MGMTLPKSPSDVLKLAQNFGDSVKNNIKTKIAKMKNNDRKFSISIDEWTSLNNKRYLNIHFYYDDGDDDNLGLI